MKKDKSVFDKYNSISGSLNVLLMKPLDVLLGMLVAVAGLCFATKYTIHHKTRSQYLVLGAIRVVGYLLNTGLSALNMQVVTNTIVRILLVPTEEVPTWCNHVDDYPHQFKNIIASYGFPARSWQQRALSSTLEPTATLTTPMNSETSELPSDEDLPMNVSIATNLAVYALVVCNTFLGWWGSGDEVWGQHSWGYDSINISVPLLMAEYLNLTTEPSATSTFVKNLHNVSVDYFNKAENANTTNELAKLEFSHIDISDVVGCIVVLVGGVFIALMAKNGKGFMFELDSAKLATEAIADDSKFQPFMLQMQLRDSIAANAEEPDLNSLRVGTVVFVDKDSESKQFTVGESGHIISRTPVFENH